MIPTKYKGVLGVELHNMVVATGVRVPSPPLIITFDKCNVCGWMDESIEGNSCPVCGSQDVDDIDGNNYEDSEY